MSHEITCRECNASNPPGSKFCSNCGAKLPASTHMICPNCESSNPHDRIFCDNCGTRLVKDATVPLEEDKPEKQGGRGAAFSLPARRPGETGELDPSLLPEWLRTGETQKETPPDEDDSQELSGWLKKSIDDTKDLVDPDQDDDTSDKKGTGDLPEWLVNDSDSGPIIEAPEEISTELYLDLVSKAEEESPEDTPDELSGANLPDWLSEANQISDTGQLSPNALGELEHENEADGVDDEAHDGPDWLASITEDGTDMPASEEDQIMDISGLTEILSMSDAPTAEEKQTDEEDDLTDWLSDAFPSEEGQPSPSQQDAADSGGLTDWLSDPFPAADEPADDPLQDDETDGLTSWLTDSFSTEEEPENEPAQDDADGLTNWLSEPFAAEDESSEEPAQETGGLDDWLMPPADDSTPAADDLAPAPSSDESVEVDDWLSELDQISESKSTGTDSFDDASDAPDWLMAEADSSKAEASQPPDTPAGIANEIEQSLAGDSEQVPTDFAELFQVESSDNEDMPDWLAGAASSGESFISEGKEDPVEDLDDLFEKEESAAQSELDWLMQTGGLDLPDVAEDDLDIPEELRDEQPSSDGFDWLSDLASLDTNTLQSADDEVEETAAVQSSDAEPELEAFDDLSALEDQLEEDDWSDTAAFLASESQLQEEMPDWLPDSESSDSGEAVADASSEEAVANEDLPNWLDDIKPGADSEELDSDFSSVLDVDTDQPAAESDTEDIDDSLQEELLPSLEAESDDAQEELPALSQDEIVAGAIPGWLQDLKPDDSKSKDLSFMDEPDPLEEEELPVETSGPLAGLRGVVGVESAIKSVQPQPGMMPFTVTTEQQQQMELLRQLVQDQGQLAASGVKEAKRLAAPAWLRILLALLLLGAVVAGLMLPGSFIDVPESSLGASASLEAIDNVAGQPVLVAFEYSPGMAGELTPQADLILQQLAQNGSPIITISQYTTGSTLAEMALSAVGGGENLGYLPGEAVGLRQLGDCINQSRESCTSIPGWPRDERVQDLVADVQLIVLLTGHRDSFVYWVEQVAQPTDLPMVVGVTQSLGPVALPYQASGQLAGVIEGAPGTAVFDQLVNDAPVNPQLEKQLNAQTFAQLLFVILFLIGMISYGAITPLVNRSK